MSAPHPEGHHETLPQPDAAPSRSPSLRELGIMALLALGWVIGLILLSALIAFLALAGF